MGLLIKRPAATQLRRIGPRTGLLRSCAPPGHAGRHERSAHAITTVATAILITIMLCPVRTVDLAQSRPSNDGAARFEVASVKANRSNAGRRGIVLQSGGLAITDLTLREVIAFAYDIPNPLRHTRIIGGAKWLDADRFDIRAKGAGTPSPERVRMMLQALLTDRFTLAIRNTTASVPIYALTKVREDGTLGPNLHRTSNTDCAALFASLRGAPPAPPRDPNDVSVCVIRAEPGLIVARSRTIADLVTIAFPRVVQDRVVVDRTGLAGNYDVRLEWTPDPRPFAVPNDLPAGLPVRQAPAAGGLSLFTAIQEQLGLRLQPQQGLVEVRMIDHVERPKED